MTDTQDPNPPDPTAHRQRVRDRYAEKATSTDACCGPTNPTTPTRDGLTEFYSPDDLQAAGDANLGLGCGNPKAIAVLTPGETVLDLGSGAGFDCFLAAREVGETGRVIGVDMTPEMIDRARTNAHEHGFEHVEFRLGEIEHLPVPDAAVDVIISNCVINLSPDKPRVFNESYRVLRPGGRLAIADVVRTTNLPPGIRDDPDSLAACVSGAEPISRLNSMLHDAGFQAVHIEPKDESTSLIRDWDPSIDLSEYLISAYITATKPA